MHTGFGVTIEFDGTNMHVGDEVKWVWANATSCSSTFDVTSRSLIAMDADGRHHARFVFARHSESLVVLCYKFKYAQGAPSRLPLGS